MDITFFINEVCSGGNHFKLTASAQGQQRRIHLEKEDFTRELKTNEDLEKFAIFRLRSFIKEDNIPLNIASINSALAVKVFKI